MLWGKLRRTKRIQDNKTGVDTDLFELVFMKNIFTSRKMEPTTQDEKQLLAELRKSIEDLELSDEDLADKNLVRFLRARNRNVDAAEVMIRNNQQWKATEDVKSLLWDFKYPKEWEDDYYYSMVGIDREGNPVLHAPFGRWDIQREMALGNKEEFIKYVYHQMEKAWTMVKKMSKDSDHLKQAVGIVDLEGLTLRQVTSLDVVEAAIRCLKTFEANHPETIKTAIVVNAPWAFQIIWKVIKPFISEHTHTKLNFVGNDKEKWKEAIMKFADPDQFPERYGGTAPDNRRYHIARDGSYTISENQIDSSEEEFNGNINDYECNKDTDSTQIIALS